MRHAKHPRDNAANTYHEQQQRNKNVNSKIKNLLLELESTRTSRESIESKLQLEYDAVFNDSKTLAKAISNAENASEYGTDENGEIYSWYRFAGLSDYADCRTYFENWLSETHCMGVDWDNDCLTLNQGESFIIQDDSDRSRDNGIYLNSKCIINESEYRDESGDVDEIKRNKLIEKHMTDSGFFPGVFRVTRYGDVFSVNTQKGVKK